ncbi:MAG: OmpA family protein [Candidatus Delongbacteria bacterium]|nr:OmpA family protein [Candidatus Delongbacteria bacterium]
MMMNRIQFRWFRFRIQTEMGLFILLVILITGGGHSDWLHSIREFPGLETCLMASPPTEIPLLNPAGANALTLLSNPSAYSRPAPAVILGYQKLFGGFVDDMNQQQAALFIPLNRYFGAVDYQQYHHKFLTEGRLSLSLGYSFGLWRTALQAGYHFSRFNYPEGGYDPADPITRMKDLSCFSLSWQQALQWRMINLGVVLHNLNRPDYSMDYERGEDYRLPFQISVEAAIRHSLNWITLQAGGGVLFRNEWVARGGGSILEDRFGLELLYSRTNWQFMANLMRISPAFPISIHYFYSTPHNEFSDIGIRHHGIYLAYSFDPTPGMVQTSSVPPPAETPRFDLRISPADSIRVTQLLKVEELNPVVPYLFFHRNSDSLIYPDSVYYARHPFFENYNRSVLKSVSDFLKSSPNDTLIIQGVQGKDEIPNDLFLRRANKIAWVLSREYGIPTTQLSIEPNPSSLINPSDRPDVQAENYAVRIGFKDRDIYSVRLEYLFMEKMDEPLLMRLFTQERDLGANLKLINENKEELASVYLDKQNPAAEYTFQPESGNLLSLTPNLYIQGTVYAQNRLLSKVHYPVRVSTSRSLRKEEKRFRIFLFDFDAYSDHSLSYKQKIDYLYGELIKRSPKHILVAGFTDDIGSEAYNRDLALKRAGFIKDELIKRGFKEEQIFIQAVGPRQPLVDNQLPWGRILNRRVEIIFTDS